MTLPVPPRRVIWELEKGCNYRCLHCVMWKNPPPRARLSREENLSAMGQLRDWLGGDWRLCLSGGEPLMAPELCEVVAAASCAGAYTHLVTNGSLLTADLASRLTDAGLDLMVVSLDGERSQTHDFSRAVPGAWRRAHEALNRMRGCARAGRPEVGVSAIVMRSNLSELPGLLEWCVGEGITFALSPLSREGDGWRELWPDEPDRVDAVLDRLLEMKAAGCDLANPPDQLEFFKRYYRDPEASFPAGRCVAGETLRVDAEGSCRLCDRLAALGNLRESGLRELWASAEARSQREAIRGCARGCMLLNCNFRGRFTTPALAQDDQPSRVA